MSRLMPTFDVVGVPVTVSPLFFGVAILLGPQTATGAPDWSLMAPWVLIVSVSIMWHELGHALAMRVARFEPSIHLGPMGGETSWGPGAQPSPRVEFLVTLAGPAAGFLLAGALLLGLALGLNVDGNPWVISTLIWVNGGWGLLNLLPMLPWDGGLATQAAVAMRYPNAARRVAGIITLAVGLGMAILAYRFDMRWALFLVFISLWSGWQALQPADETDTTTDDGFDRDALDRLIEQHRYDDARQSIRRCIEAGAVDTGYENRMLNWLARRAFENRDLAAARRCLEALPSGVDPEPLTRAHLAFAEYRYDDAIPLFEACFEAQPGACAAPLARAYAEVGRPDDAVALLDRFDANDSDHGLVATALFYTGHYRAAATVATRSFERFGRPHDAYNVACSYAQLGELDAGIEWLARAVDAGLDDPLPSEDEDLAPLRGAPRFDALVSRVKAAQQQVRPGAAAGRPAGRGYTPARRDSGASD